MLVKWHSPMIGVLTAGIMHAIALTFVIFSFKGAVNNTYKLDVVFLGNILSPQEVIPSRHEVSVLQVEEKINDSTVPLYLSGGWLRSLQAEKPESFYRSMPPEDKDIFHFSGVRVVPEDRDEPSVAVVEDVPVAPLDLRLRLP